MGQMVNSSLGALHEDYLPRRSSGLTMTPTSSTSSSSGREARIQTSSQQRKLMSRRPSSLSGGTRNKRKEDMMRAMKILTKLNCKLKDKFKSIKFLLKHVLASASMIVLM